MPVLIFNFIAYSNSNNIINNFKRRNVNDRNLQGHIVQKTAQHIQVFKNNIRTECAIVHD